MHCSDYPLAVSIRRLRGGMLRLRHALQAIEDSVTFAPQEWQPLNRLLAAPNKNSAEIGMDDDRSH